MTDESDGESEDSETVRSPHQQVDLDRVGEDTSEEDDAGRSDDTTTDADPPDERAPDERDGPQKRDDREQRDERADPEAGGEAPDPTPAQSVDAPDQPTDFVPEDVATYDRFEKIDGGTYERANEFLRDRTYITAREWALARLCADFRTETGVEMTKIGEHLPELVPFMTDTYSPQAVNEARASFEQKVRTAGATFLYGAMSGFFTADELDDLMYESTEVAKFLLEVEGVELSVEDELDTEERISSVMRDVRESSTALRHDRASCPECGHEFELDAE